MLQNNIYSVLNVFTISTISLNTSLWLLYTNNTLNLQYWLFCLFMNTSISNLASWVIFLIKDHPSSLSLMKVCLSFTLHQFPQFPQFPSQQWRCFTTSWIHCCYWRSTVHVTDLAYLSIFIATLAFLGTLFQTCGLLVDLLVCLFNKSVLLMSVRNPLSKGCLSSILPQGAPRLCHSSLLQPSCCSTFHFSDLFSWVYSH